MLFERLQAWFWCRAGFTDCIGLGKNKHWKNSQHSDTVALELASCSLLGINTFWRRDGEKKAAMTDTAKAFYAIIHSCSTQKRPLKRMLCFNNVLFWLDSVESFVWTLFFLLVVTRDAQCAASLFSLCSVWVSAVPAVLPVHLTRVIFIFSFTCSYLWKVTFLSTFLSCCQVMRKSETKKAWTLEADITLWD